jgi:hypothetical protein
MKKIVLFAALMALFGFLFTACACKKEQAAEAPAEVAEDEVLEGASGSAETEAAAPEIK